MYCRGLLQPPWQNHNQSVVPIQLVLFVLHQASLGGGTNAVLTWISGGSDYSGTP